MTTAQQIITDAYIEAQVSDLVDGPDADESVIGLRWLNRIIATLSTKNTLIPYSTSENFAITSASATYTMGSGGTASSTRAKKILSGFIRDSSGNDYPMKIISEIDYNQIRDKDLGDRPRELFYDPVYPVGIITFNCTPDTSYTAYIESQKNMHSTLTLGATFSLPAEYEEALITTLAAKIALVNGAPNMQVLAAFSSGAWKSIAELNISQRVPTADLPFSSTTDSRELFT